MKYMGWFLTGNNLLTSINNIRVACNYLVYKLFFCENWLFYWLKKEMNLVEELRKTGNHLSSPLCLRDCRISLFFSLLLFLSYLLKEKWLQTSHSIKYLNWNADLLSWLWFWMKLLILSCYDIRQFYFVPTYCMHLFSQHYIPWSYG